MTASFVPEEYIAEASLCSAEDEHQCGNFQNVTAYLLPNDFSHIVHLNGLSALSERQERRKDEA